MRFSLELEECFRLLGVRSDADLPEIKSAFRRLARENHPDRNKNPGAKEKFNAITEAYSTILSSHGTAVWKRSESQKDSPEDDFGGKLSFTIFTDKEVVHSVSPRLLEREIRKRFNPDLAPGTSCKIGKTWFEVDIDESKKLPLFGSSFGKHKVLYEWYKAQNGTDQRKATTWDAFWAYVRRYVSLASI